MSDYKVGTPADIYYADTKVRGLRVPGGWSLETDWASFLSDDVVTEVRPLVVLDLAAPLDYVAALRGLAELGSKDNAGGWAIDALRIAKQIEQQSRPPKPAEPTGLGAVVEDSKGHRWVRNPVSATDELPWWRSDLGGPYPYAELDVVRVLSEGVQP